jgi:uncharacterized circularly permuted ATP-grasp superfamily protein
MGSELAKAFDEAWAAPGVPRAEYAELLHALDGVDLAALSASVAERLAERGVTFGQTAFVVDPVPRLIASRDWHGLEAGLAQRARALNRFLLDAYGQQEIIEAGILPLAVVEQAEGFEPDLVDRMPPFAWPAAIIGFDVVRDPAGEFLVLEDNLRTPSGFAYALAARQALWELLPRGVPTPRPTDPLTWTLLHDVMRAAAPAGLVDPRIVVLTDTPDNVAAYEHARTAEALGAILATPEDLVLEGTGLRVRGPDGGLEGVDVVYRRTNEDRVRDERGELTEVAAVLLEPWRSGNLGLINAFGNGVADDKLVHSHVEDFVRFYLDEEPLIRSVPTTSVDVDTDAVLGRLDELVVKPRHSHGGIGVVIGPHADADDLDRLAHDLRQDPTAYISQPTVTLSEHPTVIGDRLEPRHVDLRPFSFAAQDVRLMPGGLSRVAFDAGALVVNSSQNGGGKDTWVLD